MLRKTKILFVMHQLNTGGAQRVILNLANNLNKKDYEVHLCLFKKKGELLQSLSTDVILHDLKSNKVINGLFKFINLVFKLKPQFVFSSITHVNLLISLIIPIFKQFIHDIKFITREVNIPSIRAKHLQSSKKLDMLYKHTISNFDQIIAQSNYMRDDIMTSYNLKKESITVISNPINREYIALKAENNNSIKLYNNNKINLVAVGVLKKQKGFDYLLKVMQLISDEFHLNIVGEGAERKRLEDLIISYGIKDKVTLHGFKSNPYAYMKQSNLVVLSSLYEGFPNVILEANACCKYVLAFECPGISEEIIIQGVNGDFVKYKDVKDFAKKITTLDYLNFNSNNIYKSVEKYDVIKILKKYEKLLNTKI